MNELMKIENSHAKIAYDSEIEMFRGEFIGLNGSADFYADNVESLKQEGIISLRVFLEMCDEKGIEPYKHYSGKFNLRIDPELHKLISVKASAENKSINGWVTDRIKDELRAFAPDN